MRICPVIRGRIFDLVSVASPVFASNATWPFVGLLVGLMPLVVGYASGLAFHQASTGLLLTPLFWACVCQDRLGKALLLVLVVIGSHSALAIFLAACDPRGAAAILPGGQAYWDQTRHWLLTGEDAEYHWAVWLPQHLRLLGAVLVGAITTLGMIPFAAGMEQVDLMNFYVGRMTAQSGNRTLSLMLGWHPWSILRGLAYTVLVFVAASWTLERVTGRAIATGRHHRRRSVLAAALIVSDGLAKLWLAPIVREQLFAAVGPDVQ